MSNTKEQKVRDMLDECYPAVKIGTLEFSPSRIVEELDPTAFRCMVADYEVECSECGEILDEDEEDEEDEGICGVCKTMREKEREEIDKQNNS